MMLLSLISVTACSEQLGHPQGSSADVIWGLGLKKLSKSKTSPLPMADEVQAASSSPSVPPQPAPEPRANVAVTPLAPPPQTPEPPVAVAAAPTLVQASEDPRQRVLALAKQARRNGDGLTASTLYRQVLTDAPDDVIAQLGLANALIDGGQASQAKPLVADLMKKRPHDPTVLAVMVRLDLAVGDIAAAAGHVALAVSWASDDRDVLMAEGMVDDMRGNHALAQRVYRQVLAVAQDDAAAVNNLGLSLMAAGDPAGALAVLAPLAKDPPTVMPVLRHNLAMAYGLLGRDREARELLALDLSSEEVESNMKYYSWLRARGAPLGRDSSLQIVPQR